MASLANDKNGRRRILFFDSDGRRKTLRLGKISKREADSVKTQVERLVHAKITRTAPPLETSHWLADIDGELAEKLTKFGLMERRQPARQSNPQPAAPTLGPFIDGYIEGRSDVKPNTREHLKRCRNHLVAFFGAERPLDAITQGDADEFRIHLRRSMAENTVRRICGRAKQFLRAAVRKRLIAESPFADMKGTGVGASDESRQHFITRDVAEKVLAACPDAQWRLLFALSRYGGLRCPSEHLALRWGDVNWELDRITVRSPKTEHHEGKGERVIPLFPELRPHLEAVWDEAPEGTEFVITRYRQRNCNLRTQLERIIRKAGLTPWPKLFQNLRASRATDLATQFPAFVAAKWLGHSPVIAAKHYQQVTDDHFNDATRKSGAKAAQQEAAMGGTASQNPSPPIKNPEEWHIPREIETWSAPPVGLEPSSAALAA